RRADRPAARGARARIRRLLGADTRWDVPVPRASGDEAGRRLRHRRVCARLRERVPSAPALLVLVPEGDEVARRAAGQLVAEAGGDPVLRVVDVAVERPVVPDRDTESGALVVLSAGSRTAEQLADLAEACADGGHEVVGVVVARPVRTRTTRSAGRPAQNGTAAVAVGGGTTGGTA
ncbi:polysaccharide biosynthesis protein, partial [Streptomyces olivaceus]|nr:polysaccharide biosynthesis protein [Streptomyces olivaceus]